jgi:hypothetical protein
VASKNGGDARYAIKRFGAFKCCLTVPIAPARQKAGKPAETPYSEFRDFARKSPARSMARGQLVTIGKRITLVSAQRPFNRPTDFIFPSVKDIRDLALSACGIDDAAAAQDQIWYVHTRFGGVTQPR